MSDQTLRSTFVDDVRSRYTSEGLSGGTVDIGGPIGQPGSLQPGQLTADDFARRLANELVARVPNVPGHGDDARLRMESFVAAMVAHGLSESSFGNAQSAFSSLFGFPRDSRLTAEECIAKIVDGIPAANLDIIRSIAEVGASDPDLLNDAEEFAWPMLSVIVVGMKDFVPLDQLAYACALAVAPVPGSVRVSREEGNDVHNQIQTHYRLDACPREVLIERTVWRCNERGVTLAQGRLNPYFNNLDQIFRSGRRGFQRADIIDLGTNPYRIFEIKTRRRAPIALVQMRMYAGLYNVGANYGARFNYPALDFGTVLHWNPNVEYTLRRAAGKRAETHQLPMVPGLILYDVFMTRPAGGERSAEELVVLLMSLLLVLLAGASMLGGRGLMPSPAAVPLAAPMASLGSRAGGPLILSSGLRRVRDAVSTRHIVQLEQLEGEVYRLAERLTRAWQLLPAGGDLSARV